MLVLPDGLYYGGVSAAAASGVASTHLLGHVDLEHLRGRSFLPFAAQAAEVALRREVRETRLDAVRLVSSRRVDADTALVLEVAGTAYDVVVRGGRTTERHQLTCQAAHTNPIPTFEVVSLSPR
jgi:(2Fe-2S) ferredoxin